MPLKLPQISRTKRLVFVIVSCTIYFFVEITIGLKTGSLALIVDAFHQLNDLISYIVALIATRLAMSSRQRPGFTFALKRCEIVGAFFNASILLALALSIFLQSIERFIDVPEVEDPFLVFVVGCVGVVLNAMCITLCHDTHGHSHGHNHGHGHGHAGHSHAPAAVGSNEKHHQWDHDHDHHSHSGETAQHHHHHYSHDHNQPSEPRHGLNDIYYQSLEDEIRAVRIPSIVTQIARPISHMIQHHGNHSHAHSHAHPHAHPHTHPHPHSPSADTTARPLPPPAPPSRFSRWRHTRFFQDEEAQFSNARPQLTLTIPPVNTKHRSLDPGSPRYVMPDSQRWYDSEHQPREVAGGAEGMRSLGGAGAVVKRGGECGHDHGHAHAGHGQGGHTHHHHDHDHAAGHDGEHEAEDGAAGHGGHGGHGHDHHNLGFAGVLIHLIGDALNNIGVVIAAVVMWKTTSPNRFYADPAVSVAIGLIIFAGSLPLTISSARVLLEAAPKGLDLKKIQEELVLIPGVASVHCLHVWQLTETYVPSFSSGSQLTFSDLICSLDVRSEARDLVVWSLVEKHIRRHLAGYGIQHVTISPEFAPSRSASEIEGGGGEKKVAGDGHQCAVLNSPSS